ncbi:DNRLRE domain-containing protein [Nonomuraea jabiensis]|uniref:DNRLRE domain-containing protein n=1 Tax=Nonomuraea jabiensis TaxID=882448 RepID=UPI00341D4106
MNTSSPASGLSIRTRRRAALIAALTLPLSLLSAPAIAQGPTPPSTTTSTPATPPSAPATPTAKALAQAKKDNRRVEIESLRSENATFYANPDGKTVRMEMHTQPIRVKNADGKGFTPIDTTLVETDGVIKPRAAHGDLVLSAGGDKTLLKSRATDATAKISTPSTLPEPRLKGNTATYPNAYGKGRDLVVTASPTGFRQQITIAERPTEPVSFRVPVDLPVGLSFKTNPAGRPIIVGKDGKTLTEIRPTLLQDAKAADAGAPLDAGKVGKAAVTLAEDGKTLVFTPDTTFLADPATTYPVTIAAAADDWYEGHTGQWSKGGMDTWINDYDYQDSWDTFTQTQIVVGKSYASGIAKRWRGYLKFPTIPSSFAGSKVENADLHLWNYQSNECGISVGSGITARRITSDWDETTLLWGSQPSVTSTGANTEYGAYSEDCTGSMNYPWNLTHTLNTIVQEWVNGATNYGIQLTAGNESELRNWRRYTSEDAGGCMTPPLEDCKFQLHPPILTVDFELPAPENFEVFYYSYTGPKETQRPTYAEAKARSQWTYDGVPSIPFMGEEAVRAQMEQPLSPDIIEPEKNVLSPEDEPALEPTPGDTTAPHVVGTVPGADATGIASSTPIKAGFSEAVWDPEITVKDGSGTDVAGVSSLSADRRELVFSPSQPLAAGTRYTVEISEAYDQAGNIMAAHSWSFSTAARPAGMWSMDEGSGNVAADSSGHGHNATLGGTARWVSGKAGNALSNLEATSSASSRGKDGDAEQTLFEALQKALQQGKPVEVTSQTTESSITYAQPDGRMLRTEITAGPVRTRQGGAWVPVDATLVEQAGKLKPKAIVEGVVVEVSTGGVDPFVKMSADGKSYALRWPTPLPKPTVKGSVATYTDAAGVGADLVVTALPAGFRHEVVLRQRPSKPLELRIGVDDEDLTLTEGKGGRLLLKGKDKKLVATAARPVMRDGSAKGRLPLAKRGEAGTDVVTKDGRTHLVLKPDQAFLMDAATTYPVRVAAAVTLPLSSDVEVTTNDTVDSPASPDLGYLTAGTMTGGFKTRVHLKFDTTNLQGSTVTDATLSMNTIDAHNCAPALANGIQVARLTSAWNPNNLYWANKPALTTEDASTNFKGVNQDCATWPDTMDWNVTGIAQDWAAGVADHGLVLKSPGEANVNNYRVYTSTENTDEFGSPPKLTITTSGPASAPAVSAPVITPAKIVDGTTVTTSLTPQLAATVADPAPGSLTGEFEVEHDPAAPTQGSGQIWAGTSQAVASGGQTTVTVPTGKLTDGWRVRWRARAHNTAASTTSAWSAWQLATVDLPAPISEPAVTALHATPSTEANGKIVTNVLTPTLSAQVSDPAGGTLRAEFEVEHDPAATGQGTGQILAEGLEGVPAGGQADMVVPTGKLSDGWVVRWRARAVSTASASSWSDWQQLTIDLAKPGEEPLARTAGPVLRTDQSFTVAAWLRWDDKDGDFSVVEQRGTHQAPFRLGNTSENGLVFTLTSADSADATSKGVLSGVEPPVGEWFHLAGTYDAISKTVSLYLNGTLLRSEALDNASWHAEAPMSLGTAMIGELDDVQVFQQVLSPSELAGVHATHDAELPVLPKSADTRQSSREATLRTTSGAVTSAQSSTAFPYERIKTKECADLREKKFPKPEGKMPDDNAVNSSWSVYTYCTSSHHSWYVEGDKGSAGGVQLSTSLVINAYAGGWKQNGAKARDDGIGVSRHPRDIAIYLRVDNVDYNNTWTQGHTGDEFIEVRIEAVSSTKDQGKCELTDSKWKTSSGAPSNRISQMARTWKDNEEDQKEWWWTYRTSANPDDDNQDAISHCAFRPYIIIHDDDAGGTPNSRSALDWAGLEAGTVPVWDRPTNIHATDPQALKDNAPSVRCDTSESYQSHYGGCIFHRVSRIYRMSRTDPAGAKPMSQVADHIFMTRDYPESTYPAKTFDRPPQPITGKQFPGHWPRKPLHYVAPNALTDDGVSVRGRNERMKDKVCKRDFPTAGAEEKECDEYPFATAQEGAGYRLVDSDPKTQSWNFSIWPVLEEHNGNAGNHKQVFEMQYRILHNDSFWVSVQ